MPEISKDTVVRLEDAHKIYNPGENEVRAMDGINLTVQKGDFMALVGPSGSGKSTVLHALGCLDRVTSGHVWVDGNDVSSLSATALSRIRNEKIGFIFQSFNLIPVMTAYENIEFSLQIQDRWSAAEMKKRVMDMIGLLGLDAQKDRRPNQLSGGQQQRIAIGRALVKGPSLILADEPTANLDRKTSEEIIGLMRKMNEQLSATFVFSTHDEHLMGHARRIVRIQDGKLLSDERKNGTAS